MHKGKKETEEAEENTNDEHLGICPGESDDESADTDGGID